MLKKDKNTETKNQSGFKLALELAQIQDNSSQEFPNELQQTASAFKKMGLTTLQIAQATGLSVEKIEAL